MIFRMGGLVVLFVPSLSIYTALFASQSWSSRGMSESRLDSNHEVHQHTLSPSSHCTATTHNHGTQDH